MLAPGWTRTPVWDTIAGDDRDRMLAEMAGRLPVGEVGTPKDMGEAAVFITRSRHLTGTVIAVNGGQHLI